MTSKQYKQKWLRFKTMHPDATKIDIWNFQKSLLSKKEQILAGDLDLRLGTDDPRQWVMEISDQAWCKASSKVVK